MVFTSAFSQFSSACCLQRLGAFAQRPRASECVASRPRARGTPGGRFAGLNRPRRVPAAPRRFPAARPRAPLARGPSAAGRAGLEGGEWGRREGGRGRLADALPGGPGATPCSKMSVEDVMQKRQRELEEKVSTCGRRAGRSGVLTFFPRLEV